MTAVVATTELEAINTMLGCINESPVSTLEVSGLADVSAAKAVLSEISRMVQERGWHFNTEREYPLTRDVNNRIQLASNIVKVDTDGNFADYNVVQRGSKLYWLDEHTDIFDKDLTGTVVIILPFEELPQAARHYIMVAASRVFQARILGSDTKFKFSQDEELRALNSLVGADVNTGDYNMLTGSWSVARILVR